jgi:ornithine cyclodeaminase/alanine dehydrogenase-like protein (mu-crystallin family)
MRYITDEDVRRSLKMPEAIRAVREALIQLSAGRAKVPARTSLEIPELGMTALIMPAYLPDSRRIGLKLISLGEGNAAKGLPTAQAVAVLMDAEAGTPLAVLDAAYLTAVRTGAASGAATDALARADARVAAVFGCGVQGRTQLEAIAAVRPIRKAYAFDTRPEAAAAFAGEMSSRLGIGVEAAVSPEVLGEVDIISTATTSDRPVFDDARLKDGVHINAIGSYKPHIREIPGETVRRAAIFVDQRRACLEEAGDLIIPLAEKLITEDAIRAEIGEVLAGRAPGRRSPREITLFKSVGSAALDVAAAGLIAG